MAIKLLIVLLGTTYMASGKFRVWDMLRNRENYLYTEPNGTLVTSTTEDPVYHGIPTYVYKPHSFFYNYDPNFPFGAIDEDLVTDCLPGSAEYCLTETQPLCYGTGVAYYVIRKSETRPCKKSKTGLCVHHPFSSCYLQYPCVENYLYRRTEMVPCVGILRGSKSSTSPEYREDYCVVAYATPERKT